MNSTSNYLAALNHILVHPTDGIVGLVDELLSICQKHRLQLDWQPDRYLVRSDEGAWEEVTNRPARFSVFLVIMERLAVLCNKQTPDSVSFDGGSGRLWMTADEAFQIDFMNTPGKRRLQLMPIRIFAAKELNGVASGMVSEPATHPMSQS